MLVESQHRTFTLCDRDIDLISEWLDDYQKELGLERKNRYRVRLLIEEALVNMSRHFGKDKEVRVFIDKRLFRRPRIRLEVRGERFNPLGAINDDADDWSQLIFSSVGLRPQYVHALDSNYLTLALPVPPINPVLKIALAILIGAMLGFLGHLVIPLDIRDSITSVVLGPIYNMWVRLLSAISGPIIFITALTTTLNTKRITDQGGSNFVLILCYFALTAVVLIFAMLCGRLFFPLGAILTDTTKALLAHLLDSVLNIVPSDLIQPLSTANTPQLLLVAFISGNVLVQLGNQVDELQRLVREANMVGLTIAKWTGQLVPFFVGLFLCLEIWNSQYELLMTIWKPLVVSIVVSLIAILVGVHIISVFMHVNPILLISKLKGQFWEVFKTGSLDSSFDELAASCEKLLGIGKEYAKAALPQGLNLYMPISVVGIYVFSVFVARSQHIRVDQIWLIRASVMAIVLFVATPPVAGANLLAYVAFFSYLGIADSALMDAMLFDIVFGVFANAANLTMLQLETILQSSRAGFLDEEVLRHSL